MPLLFALPQDLPQAQDFAALCGLTLGPMTARTFPDGETYIRVH